MGIECYIQNPKAEFAELETASEIVLERIGQLVVYQVWSRLLSGKMMY